VGRGWVGTTGGSRASSRPEEGVADDDVGDGEKDCVAKQRDAGNRKN